jgi:hypothetical protein
MCNVEKVNIFSEGEDSSKVTNHKFLVVLITNEETKKRIRLSKAAMAHLTKIKKDFETSTNTNLSYCRQQSFQQYCMGAKERR